MLFLLWSCTERIEFNPIVDLNTNINVSINVYMFPEEDDYPNWSWTYREVIIYKSKEDFVDKVNPISSGRYMSMEPHIDYIVTIHLKDINYSVLYIRASVWGGEHSDQIIKKGTYIYLDSIPIPAYNCNISVNLNNTKWEQEN